MPQVLCGGVCKPSRSSGGWTPKYYLEDVRAGIIGGAPARRDGSRGELFHIRPPVGIAAKSGVKGFELVVTAQPIDCSELEDKIRAVIAASPRTR